MQSSKRPVSRATRGDHQSLSHTTISNSVAPSRTLTASEARQQLVDTVTARSFVYRFLAKAFEFPNEKSWRWLSNPTVHTSFCSAIRKLEMAEAPLRRSTQDLVLQLHPGQFEPFRDDYLALFSPSAIAPCALHEAAYVNDVVSLADLFRETDLEFAASATERQDHICTELELMSMLAAKEAYALERHWRSQQSSCFEAQRKVLKNHLSRWLPAFCEQVHGRVAGGVLASLVQFTQSFIKTDCHKFGVKAVGITVVAQPTVSSLEKFYHGGESLTQ